MSEDKNIPEENEEQIDVKEDDADDMPEQPSDDYKGMYLRALADYQNLLKQTARDKEEFCKFANEGLLSAILPVYDNLKLAVEHADDKNKDSWLQGVKHVVKQLKDALSDHGVKEVEAEGKDFDYATMEAVSKEETDKEKLNHKVAKVLKPGYTLNSKVIVHAKVVIFDYKKSE